MLSCGALATDVSDVCRVKFHLGISLHTLAQLLIEKELVRNVVNVVPSRPLVAIAIKHAFSTRNALIQNNTLYSTYNTYRNRTAIVFRQIESASCGT